VIYSYARVSTDGRSVAAQLKELREAGAEKFFRETASGAKSDRAQLRRALGITGTGYELRYFTMHLKAPDFPGQNCPCLSPQNTAPSFLMEASFSEAERLSRARS
jgi:hypothetical protein